MSAFALKDLEFQSHDRWRNRFGGWLGWYPSVGEFLCRCKYFQVERLLLNTEGKSKLAELYTGSSSFQALLCLDGEGYILTEDKEKLAYSKGNCIFIPANTGKLQLCGRSQFLKISC